MPTRRLWPALALAAAFGCAAREPHAEDAPPTVDDPRVYAVVLDHLYRPGRPDTILVRDSTLAFRSSVPLGRLAATMPRELIDALVAASVPSRSARALPLPHPVRYLGDAELAELFARGVGEGWAEFHRRYPDARQYVGLSPIAYDAGGDRALLFVSYACGGLCGGGALLLLERAAEGRWELRERADLWVS